MDQRITLPLVEVRNWLKTESKNRLPKLIAGSEVLILMELWGDAFMAKFWRSDGSLLPSFNIIFMKDDEILEKKESSEDFGYTDLIPLDDRIIQAFLECDNAFLEMK